MWYALKHAPLLYSRIRPTGEAAAFQAALGRVRFPQSAPVLRGWPAEGTWSEKMHRPHVRREATILWHAVRARGTRSNSQAVSLTAGGLLILAAGGLHGRRFHRLRFYSLGLHARHCVPRRTQAFQVYLERQINELRRRLVFSIRRAFIYFIPP